MLSMRLRSDPKCAAAFNVCCCLKFDSNREQLSSKELRVHLAVGQESDKARSYQWICPDPLAAPRSRVGVERFWLFDGEHLLICANDVRCPTLHIS